MGVAEQFVEAARLIDSGEVYYASTAAMMAGVLVKKREAYFDTFWPPVLECKDERTMSLLFAAEMVKTGDLR